MSENSRDMETSGLENVAVQGATGPVTGASAVATLFEGDDNGADISPCGLYRYSLWRRWDYGKPAVLFVMLNPSTADATANDLTVTKCIGFARRWDAGGIRVCNLYAYRATNPEVLTEAAGAGIDPVAGRTYGGILNANDSALYSAACDAGRIVAAWGAWTGPFPTRAWRVLDILRRYRPVEALALTQSGQPRHPSRLGYANQPVVYREMGGLDPSRDGSSDSTQTRAPSR